jgi:phosphatidylinositol-3,4,5-trisphosphate 3-phosphatase/dual-specificity protein phosphatase PTEN
VVADFPWKDHHSPPIDLLVKACDELLRWMLEHPENIGVINCDAGKGRTGTFICCFLLYSRRFTIPEQAFEYYRSKRFFSGGGVTHPSQRRAVYYFNKLIQRQIRGPLSLVLREVSMLTAPHTKKNR